MLLPICNSRNNRIISDRSFAFIPYIHIRTESKLPKIVECFGEIIVLHEFRKYTGMQCAQKLNFVIQII